MHSLGRWIVRRFQTLSFVPDYVRAMAKQWVNILFGETLLAIVFLLWWALANPSNRHLVAAFVIAAFIAGYFAWRADHTRLIQKVALGDVRAVVTPTTIVPSGHRGPDRAVVQLAVQCETDVRIEACRGKLVSVSKWDASTGQWQGTAIDEPLDLLWSVIDSAERSLDPKIPVRLNMFYLEDVPNRRIHICTDRIPFRMEQVFLGASANDVFKFDLVVSSTDGPTATASFRVKLGNQFSNPDVVPI
jgi:hypothetical protein